MTQLYEGAGRVGAIRQGAANDRAVVAINVYHVAGQRSVANNGPQDTGGSWAARVPRLGCIDAPKAILVPVQLHGVAVDHGHTRQGQNEGKGKHLS
jgi:hypothetical protein